MSQKIDYIRVEDLVLWTENPRDPIDSSASDVDIIKRAIFDSRNKWNLRSLANEMGAYYDFSELPIVVYKNGKPVVYDGNRRVVLAKLKLGIVEIDGYNADSLPDVPKDLPCNVCSEDIALESVYRKHVNSRNSWGALERDIFTSKFQHQEKSTFLMFDENTGGFISRHPEMNQGFVRKEVLTESHLREMGFEFDNGMLCTRHSDDEVEVLLNNLLDKIKSKEISTRGVFRGKPISVLDRRVQEIISSNKDKDLRPYNVPTIASGCENPVTKDSPTTLVPKKTRVTKSAKIPFFGDKLVLKAGNVNNLYRDILALCGVIEDKNNGFSDCAFAIIRMSLRLLCETASKELGYRDFKDYIWNFGANAKKKLDQDTKTLLSNQNVSPETLTQLLQTGAHNYLSSTSVDQAKCISILLGAILTESHGRSK